MKIRHLCSVASLTSVCRIAAKMNPREFCTTKVMTKYTTVFWRHFQNTLSLNSLA